MKILFLVLVMGFACSAQAQEDVIECSKDVKFEKVISLQTDEDKSVDLILNGVGKKKVLFFNVAFGALYLETPSQDAEEILASDQIKVGVIHNLRSASKGQLTGLWNAEFEKRCGDLCEELLPFHETLLGYFRDVEKYERLYLMIFKDRFEFEVNGNEFYDPIYSPEYADLMQRMLIGPDASDKNLEKALLGQTKACRNS